MLDRYLAFLQEPGAKRPDTAELAPTTRRRLWPAAALGLAAAGAVAAYLALTSGEPAPEDSEAPPAVAVPGKQSARPAKGLPGTLPPDGKAVKAGQPPVATAPFDAAGARAHQEAWAKHLGIPVAFTNSVGMKFRLIPPGEFQMGTAPDEIEECVKVLTRMERAQKGSPDFKWIRAQVDSEGPLHKVVLTRAYYLGTTEVTAGQYEKVPDPARRPALPAGKGQAPGEPDDRPRTGLFWHTAADFCERLSLLEANDPGLSRSAYRLPTEAEWEFACRGGTTTRYWCGDDPAELLKVEWTLANTPGRQVHTVAGGRPNPFGLFDMHGNVQEWARDLWGATYYARASTDPAGPEVPDPDEALGKVDYKGPYGVLRGGSVVYLDWTARSASRSVWPRNNTHGGIGFRVALPADHFRAVRARAKVE